MEPILTAWLRPLDKLDEFESPHGTGTLPGTGPSVVNLSAKIVEVLIAQKGKRGSG